MSFKFVPSRMSPFGGMKFWRRNVILRTCYLMAPSLKSNSYLNNNKPIGKGNAAQWIGYLLLDPPVPGLNHSSGVFLGKKISDIAVLIVRTLLIQSTVKIIIKLIEPIQYLVVAS